jgi:hypothetical protein
MCWLLKIKVLLSYAVPLTPGVRGQALIGSAASFALELFVGQV